eukprot:7489133-Alexandrium_andersonii.AAC.1
MASYFAKSNTIAGSDAVDKHWHLPLLPHTRLSPGRSIAQCHVEGRTATRGATAIRSTWSLMVVAGCRCPANTPAI